MEPMKFHCKCGNPSSLWREEPKESRHAFRVECGTCGTFIKWGAEAELHYRVKARDKVTVEMMEDRPQPASLDQWVDFGE